MATEFHFFPLLPWELRNQIWNLAIRPALPGAHVFRARFYFNDSPSEQDDPDDDDDPNDYNPNLRLVAPQCLPKGVDFSPAAQAAAPISWTLNNSSTYLIDSGLWTACKESLLAIEKEFQVRARAQREKGWSLEEMEMFREHAGRLTLPETSTQVAGRGSKRRYLTVFPIQDLVILQSVDVTLLDWEDWNFVWNSFPAYDLHREDWWYRGNADNRLKDRHIALEYNPAWDVLDRSLIRDIVHGTAPTDWFFTLWFIDYRIKRNPRYQTPTKEQAKGWRDPAVFYGSDRRYVEVGDLGRWVGDDLMWNAGDELSAELTLDFDTDSYHKIGADAFVEELESELVDYCEDYKDNNHDVTSWGYDWGKIRYGLLACEYL